MTRICVQDPNDEHGQPEGIKVYRYGCAGYNQLQGSHVTLLWVPEPCVAVQIEEEELSGVIKAQERCGYLQESRVLCGGCVQGRCTGLPNQASMGGREKVRGYSLK